MDWNILIESVSYFAMTLAAMNRRSGKVSHAMVHSTAVYWHMNDQEVTENSIKSPFKFLNSRFSSEIKKRFGSDFYPAVAKHLHDFMLGKRDPLISLVSLKVWDTVLDEFSG